MTGGAAASSVLSQMPISAADAGVVEKDRVAELEPTAATVSPVITVSVGDVPPVPASPELPPHPQSSAHSHKGPVIVRRCCIVFFRWVVGTWNQYTVLAVAAVTPFPKGKI